MSELGSSGDGMEEFVWESTSDLTAVSEKELEGLLERLAEEEREISYRRRVLQGRIDLIRSELVRRGSLSLSPEELARILMGRQRGGPEA